MRWRNGYPQKKQRVRRYSENVVEPPSRSALAEARRFIAGNSAEKIAAG
jgi:hypothetical protein